MKSSSETTARRTVVRGARGCLWAAAVAMPVLVASAAQARPEPIPQPPGERPPPGASPGTGQPAPADPADPTVIPPPQGLACIEGADQTVCDPSHPGGPQGAVPGNEPQRPWFDDMATWMFGMQESLGDLSAFGQEHSPLIDYYATWLTSVTQQYYALAYLPDASPRPYGFGPMTRGDFNYYYYYWVRPIYFSLLHYAAEYYVEHAGSTEIGAYEGLIGSVAWNYHALVRCNYGLDGDDKAAREDVSGEDLERTAGVKL